MLIRRSIHLLIIIIAPLLLFWRWVVKGEVLFWGTTLFQFWPWHSLVKSRLLAGEWPLWNPLLGNGTPLLANLQSAVFYPLNLIYLMLPIEHGLTLSVVLHLALAGLFMYLYTRTIGLDSFAALISALAFLLSGYLVGRTQFVPMVNTAAWLPLLLLLGERLVARRTWLDVLWLGFVFAVQLLAGHAQLWFYTLCLISAYVFFRSWQQARQRVENKSTTLPGQIKNDVQTLIQVGGRLGLAIGLALLLDAAQLLPTAEFTSQSPRGSGAERTFALTYSFWPWRFVTLLAPNFFGHPATDNYWGYANYWEDHAYMGVLPILFALTAAWHYFKQRLQGRYRKQRPPLEIESTPAAAIPPTQPNPSASARELNSTCQHVIPFFAGLIPVSLILALGWNTPIYLWVFDTIPGFSYFQAPSRLLIWYTTAMAVLAGIGAQSFFITPRSRPYWRRLLVACIGIALASLAGTLLISGRSLTFLTGTASLSIWLILSILLLLALPDQDEQTGRLPRSPIWEWAIIMVVTIDLLWATLPLIPTLPAAIFRQPLASAEFLQAQPGDYRYFVTEPFDYATKFDQYFRFDRFGPLQVEHWQQLRETLVPNVGVYAGLPSANNDDPLVVGRWQQLTDLIKTADEIQRARLLSLMNVGYVIDRSEQTTWPTIYDDGSLTIHRVSQPLPRAYFVSQIYPARDQTEVIVRLSAPDFDPYQEPVIMESGHENLPVTGDEDQRRTNLSLSYRPGSRNAGAAEITPVLAGSDRRATSAGSLSQDGSVTVDEQGPGRVLLTVEAPAAGFVVLTDTFYPGWRAEVDGQVTQIWMANLAFRAVEVEPGTHNILFSYRPRSFTIGLWVSGLTLVAGIAAGVYLVVTLLYSRGSG
jgi:hypothetical protein